MGRPRSTHYKWHRRSPGPRPPVKPRRPQPRALSTEERQKILDELHSERFQDQSPTAVYATLLDEGNYLGSISTFYRILRSQGEVRERRAQATHPPTVKPELVATRPNEIWSWDITKLYGPVKWTYYYLYVILDVYSHYVVGWLVAPKESAELAKQLIAETVRKEGIARDSLTIHADRGSSMASKPVAFLLADLGVTKSHSRPHVSNDNPYSESQFKTLKYRPDFPDRFTSIEHARQFCRAFFRWYNEEHHHSGIGLLTPTTLHHGLATEVIQNRAQVLTEAFEAHPERFVHGKPLPPAVPKEAWINQPEDCSLISQDNLSKNP